MNISRWSRGQQKPPAVGEHDASPPDPSRTASRAWPAYAGFVPPGSDGAQAATATAGSADGAAAPGVARELAPMPRLTFAEPGTTASTVGHGLEAAVPDARREIAVLTPEAWPSAAPDEAHGVDGWPMVGHDDPAPWHAPEASWPPAEDATDAASSAHADEAPRADAWPAVSEPAVVVAGPAQAGVPPTPMPMPESAPAASDPDDELSTRSPETFGARPASAPGPGDRSVGRGTAWEVDTGIAVVQPRSATEVLTTLAEKVSVGAVEQYQPVPLGFTPLDKTIGGGLRAGELLLLGGAQGTGKTTMAVQMARNIVLGGQASVLYICFEHDEEYLLNRVIALESVLEQLPQKNSGVKLQDVRREILGTWLAQGSERADLSANPRLRPALERISRYGANLFLLRGSQTHSTIENLHELVRRYKELSGDRRLVVFIDYMQKVPVIPEPPSETEKVTYIVQGLKDLALTHHVPMVSIVAADKEGLKASRLRNHHLRGSSAINYEADIILILNEKYNIVAKVNIEFNPYQAQRFRDWVICTVEKNRGGQNAIDLEFQKHFEFSCFDASGRTVQEKLIEERLYND